MLAKISQLFTNNFLQKRCDLPVILPFYHCIDEDNNCPHIRNLYSLRNIETFSQDIDYLCRNYKAISIEELLAWSEGKIKIKQPCFHLTFDDGLRQCYDIIAPILKGNGVPASFFINSDFVDNKDLMYRYKISLLIEKLSSIQSSNLPDKAYLLQLTQKDIPIIDTLCQRYEVNISEFLKAYQPYCTSAQLQEMIDDGFHIGSHSENHPRFHELSIAEQKEQSINAENFISKELYKGKEHIKTFAFPFTDNQVSSKFWENLPFDLTFGTAGLKHSSIPKHLQRIAIENHCAKASLQSILKTNYLAYWIKKYLGKHYTKHTNF